MYIYDIISQNKGQYALLMSYDNEYWGAPLNVNKKVYYLKNKMKAHRDEVVESGHDDIIYYRIVTFQLIFFNGFYCNHIYYPFGLIAPDETISL